MPYQHSFTRHKTREVRVGDKIVGGQHPIWVQSMTTTDTHDLEGTIDRQPGDVDRSGGARQEAGDELHQG